MSKMQHVWAWILAPAAAAMLSIFSAKSGEDLREYHQPGTSAAAVSTIDAKDTRPSAKIRWQAARKLEDPLRRAQASWEAIDSMSLEELAASFNQALADDDYERITMLGDAWAIRDVAHFLNAVSGRSYLGSPSPVSQLIDASFIRYADQDSAAAFQLFQTNKIRNWRLSSPFEALMARYLSDYPEKAAEIDLSKERFWGWGDFTGDVHSLAEGLEGLPKHAKRSAYLGFLGRAILGSEPSDVSQGRFLDWWKALPEELQREAIPWNAGPELMNQPGLHEWFAGLARDKIANVSSYMQFFGKEWAAENPGEAFDWVMARYQGETVTGPPTLLAPNHYSSEGFFISLDEPSPYMNSANYLTAVAAPIRAMAQRDPQRALVALAEIPYMRTKSELYPMIGEEWAKSDPAAALAWAETLPGKYSRDKSKAHIEYIVTGKWPSGY